MAYAMRQFSPEQYRQLLLSTTRSRRTSTSSEILLQTCPSCGDSKWRTYANPFKGIAYCQRNSCVTRLSDMFETETPIDFVDSEPEPEAPKPGVLWETWTTDWSLNCSTKQALGYARIRKIPQRYIDDGTLGYFAGGELKGRLGIRVTRNGQPIFAVGRSLGHEKPKYKYPREATVGIGKGQVLFGLDEHKAGDEMVLVEGTISAMSAPNCVATLGNTLSEEQALLIEAAKPSRVTYTYEDNIHFSHAVFQASRLFNRGIETYVAPMLRGDFNDDPTQYQEVLDGAIRIGAYSVLALRGTGFGAMCQVQAFRDLPQSVYAGS